MYDKKVIEIALNMYHNRKRNNVSISKILKDIQISRSTLYKWIKEYYPNNSDNPSEVEFDKKIVKLRMYNRKSTYKKFDDLCISSIINYVKGIN